MEDNKVLRVALLQMKVALGEATQNYQTFQRLAAEAMEEKPDVLVLPELWNTGFYPSPIRDFAAAEEKRAVALLAATAEKYGVHIVGGSIPTLEGDKVYNTSLVFNRQGEQIAAYRKVHLFSPGGEDREFTPGDAIAGFELDGVKCATAICYDLRFPEIMGVMARRGAQIIFLPAAWPLKRLTHWQVLMRARAIENQCFVAAVGGVGFFAGDLPLGGHSAIIDPWGELLAAAAQDEMVVRAVCDTRAIHRARRAITVYADRRPELYAKSQL
ncbi:MAG: carbon-nitrogen family hydrolase [Selenomonadaceae bacterium]|nr:carbon-nitrogen family hydrolase [Selenomonadaceae bacterium]